MDIDLPDEKNNAVKYFACTICMSHVFNRLRGLQRDNPPDDEALKALYGEAVRELKMEKRAYNFSVALGVVITIAIVYTAYYFST